MISSDLKSVCFPKFNTRWLEFLQVGVALFFVEDSTDPDVRRMRLIRGVKKGHKELFYIRQQLARHPTDVALCDDNGATALFYVDPSMSDPLVSCL